ncbi:tyrosine-type recombinase/integrase [Haloferax profundi]|uniref:Integrase n=1 Tax=Haloferax profundi TaxID=1544718 RepID=A0A0W1SW33_9EURY|nr:site-specific integrase [Haloferax profundi]KTG30647.1 integrase [Haloferax profundi]
MTERLDPIEPSEAVRMYLAERSTEVSEATLKAHKSRLKYFLRWCSEEDIDNMNTLTGRSLHRYKLWRRDDGDLKQVSLKTQIATIRVFIRFCESIDAVEPDLHTKVLSPSLGDADDHRDVMLDAEDSVAMLDFLRRFHYASFDHVLLKLLWHTGMRTGSVQAIDVEDYDPESEYLKVQHRPETPLKNKKNGERLIALSADTCAVLDDWLAHNRPDVVDDSERVPLLATTHGRPHKTTIRDAVYRWTRPCQYGAECPHGRDRDDCEATDDQKKTASKCPSSVSPHAIRRGSITHFLTEDVPEKVVSDRMNVSPDILDKHYDRRSEEVKVEQRRGYLKNL